MVILGMAIMYLIGGLLVVRFEKAVRTFYYPAFWIWIGILYIPTTLWNFTKHAIIGIPADTWEKMLKTFPNHSKCKLTKNLHLCSNGPKVDFYQRYYLVRIKREKKGRI